MEIKDKIELIKKSVQIDNNIKNLLPEPLSDKGYYYVYYPTSLYKEAYIDILNYDYNDITIFYDRKIESGKDYENYLLDTIKEYNCIGIIVYLNEEAIKDEFLYKLMTYINYYHKSYFTINYAKENGKTLSGYQLALNLNLDSNKIKLYKKMFADEITFLLGNEILEQKIKAIKELKKDNLFIYKIIDGKAVITGIKDIFVYDLVIPKYIEEDNNLYEVVAIGSFAFANLPFLKNIILPDSIIEAGGYYKLKKLGFGYTFLNCKSLRKISFPKGCKRIYNEVFTGCTNLRKIDISNVEYVDPSFLGEDDKKYLKEIYVNNNIYKINGKYCDRYFNDYDFGSNVLVYNYTDLSELESLTLPTGAIYISDIIVGNENIKEIIFNKDYLVYDEDDEDDEVFVFLEDVSNLEKCDFNKIKTNKIFKLNISDCPNVKEIILPVAKGYVLDFLKGNNQIKEIHIKQETKFLLITHFNRKEKFLFKKMMNKLSEDDEEVKHFKGLNKLSLEIIKIDNPDCLTRKGYIFYAKEHKLSYKEIKNYTKMTYETVDIKFSKFKHFILNIVMFILLKISPNLRKEILDLNSYSIINRKNICSRFANLKEIYLKNKKIKIKGFKYVKEIDGYYYYKRK